MSDTHTANDCPDAPRSNHHQAKPATSQFLHQLACHITVAEPPPLAMDKLEGPTHYLMSLGIDRDTQVCVMRFPQETLGCIRMALGQRWHKKSCMKRELESLIGILQHACRVMRIFSRANDRAVVHSKATVPSCSIEQPFPGKSCMVEGVCNWLDGIAFFPPPCTVVISDASEHWGRSTWYQTASTHESPPHRLQRTFRSIAGILADDLSCDHRSSFLLNAPGKG